MRDIELRGDLSIRERIEAVMKYLVNSSNWRAAQKREVETGGGGDWVAVAGQWVRGLVNCALMKSELTSSIAARTVSSSE